jgi:hypothetical protein
VGANRAASAAIPHISSLMVPSPKEAILASDVVVGKNIPKFRKL